VADAFGANLRRLREESGLSQESLSLRASLIRTYVGMIENGDRVPGVDTALRLAGALAVEPGDLFAGIYWQPDDSDRGGHIIVEPPEGAVES
jgi:transcriptional regulator with XRE-family HTH domain